MQRPIVLVVSGINFFEGGPLSIIKDCLKHLSQKKYKGAYKIIALVHRESLFDKSLYSNIEFIEFPKSRKSYFYRLYYEYIYFKKFAKQKNVDFWLSLHDISPNVGGVKQAVYCHNPSPFNKIKLSNLYLQPVQFFFRLFYSYLYRINIHRNQHVIVQQLWLKMKFHYMFSVELDKIVVAKPAVAKLLQSYPQTTNIDADKSFFFPTFPRPFKNVEVICEAVKLLNENSIYNFKVYLTLDGTENKYAKVIFDKYNGLENIHFLGLINRNEVYELYSKCDCLIFPSKLETWGLPISEFKEFNKPIFVSDLPYARETVADYPKAKYFDSEEPTELASLMKSIILGQDIDFDISSPLVYPEPFAEDWGQLFNILLINI